MSEYFVIELFGLALVTISSSVANNSNTVYSVSSILNAIYGEQLSTFTARSILDCTRMCSKAPSCRSVLFDANLKLCSTNRWTMDPQALVSCNPGDGCPALSVRKYAKKIVKTTMRQPCKNDTDCVDSMSECRLGNCACVPGYSYNRTSCSCVTECTHYGTTFQMVQLKKLHNNNDESYIAPSLENCKNTCIAATSYVCRSIDYYPDKLTTTNCHLSSITAATRPDLYQDQLACELYTRDCL